MELRRTALAVACTLGLAQSAPALTIDNFMEGPTLVVDDGNVAGPTTEELGGFSNANTVGGTRFVSVESSSVVLPTALVASASIDPTGALLTAGEVGVFLLQYDGTLNGTADGSAGSLDLDLSGFTFIDVTATVLAPGAVANLRIWDSLGADMVTGVPLANGTTSYDLADFGGIDLSDIQAIQLRVGGVGPLGSPEVLIQSIVAVPEPGTALLLSLGLSALGMAGRRRSA